AYGAGFSDDGYPDGSSGGTMERASGAFSSMAGSAADSASHLSHRTAEAAWHVSDRARHAGSRAQRMFSDTLDQEPLILGALGVAVGAAIGAMLPTTRFEEEYVAP